MQGVSSITGPFITPLGVKERPFQAHYEQVTIKDSDGETFRHIKSGIVYRTSDGRSRKEEYANGGAQETISTIIIHDPTKQEGYLLDVETRTFFTMPLSNTSTSAESPTFTGDDIGRRVIEGLTCRGYQRKSQNGGTVEYWVSEELLEVVLARSLVGGEENTLRLFNIHRVESDSKLFTVPFRRRLFKWL
jgi:hypothetical protein